MAEQNLSKFIINYLTEEQYQNAKLAQTLDENSFYCTLDDNTGGSGSGGGSGNSNIFTWDGLSSEENPNNLTLWKAIYEMSKIIPVMVYSGKTGVLNSYYIAVISAGELVIPETGLGSVNIIGFPCAMQGNSSTTGESLISYISSTRLTFEEGQLTKVEALTPISQEFKEYLPTNSTTVTNYVPTYDYHPATKKYVDEMTAAVSAKTIVTSLEEMTDPKIIYLLAIEGDANNTYEEYLVVNGVPEIIGTTRIDLTNYLAKDNTTEYTPTEDFHPATKQYVDSLLTTITALEERVVALEAMRSNIAVDPEDTTGMNIWIETE